MDSKRYLRIKVSVSEHELARLRAKAQARGVTLAALLREESLSDVVVVPKAA